MRLNVRIFLLFFVSAQAQIIELAATRNANAYDTLIDRVVTDLQAPPTHLEKTLLSKKRMPPESGFTSTKPQSLSQKYPGLHFGPVLVSILFWAIAFPFITASVSRLLDVFCTKIPVNCAFIPAALPHQDPPGFSPPFEIPLEKASDAQLRAFKAYRGLKDTADLTDVARDAAVYKGELFAEKAATWEIEHFVERKPNLRFPLPTPHWNGWAGWWLETALPRRNLCVGNFAFAVEHFICGFVFPVIYLYGEQLGLPLGGKYVSFAIAMYGDIGANVVDIGTVLYSYATGENKTIMQYTRAIWPLVLMHHVAGIGMCATALSINNEPARDLGCLVIIGLLGVTGFFHILSATSGYTPFYDSPKIMLVYQSVVLSTMIWFRGIYWCVLVYRILHIAYSGGIAMCVFVGAAMLLFTAFNKDFIEFNIKVFKVYYKRAAKSNDEPLLQS